MKVPFVDLVTQYRSIKPEIDQAIDGIVSKAAFVGGEAVAKFEEEFAALCGTRFAVGVSSGTAALELAMRAMSFEPGFEVITAANTFIATAAAISHAGGRTRFVDIDPETYCMDPAAIERAISPQTRAIIPVHLYGHPAGMGPILEIARKHGLRVIEDAAQAHGAKYKGRVVGSMGDVSCFSFYPGKNLGAYGDGGMVVTNDEEMAKRIRLLIDHGRASKFEHTVEGFNHRLDGLQAAVLRVKLRHLQEWNEARRRAAASYNSKLAGADVVTPREKEGCSHVYHLYVIQVEGRDRLRDRLADHDVASGIHYPIPLHRQPAFAYLGYEEGSFPVAERTCDRIVSLPMFPELTVEATDEVARLIKEHIQMIGAR